MAATDARPVPKKGVAYRHYFAIRKNDGTLITTWAGQDSERSLDGAGFSDCTNEATEDGTSGCGYIDLTNTEMNADEVTLKVTVTNTGALPYVVFLFPEEAGDIRADITMLGSVAQSATDLKDFADTGYDPSTHKVAGVVLVDTTTTNDDMRGTDGAALSGDLDSLTDDVGTIDGKVDTIKDNLDTVGETVTENLDAKVSTRSTVTTAQVNAEVLDVLNVDTLTEPTSGAPSATVTLMQAISRLFFYWRNKKTQTNSVETMCNDAGSPITKRAISDDETTLTKDEWIAP